MKKIAEYITKKYITIDADAPLVDAIEMMKINQLSSILVFENGAPVGIFTERDILLKLDFRNFEDFGEMKIRDVMTQRIISIDFSDSYTSAIDLMKNNNFRHLPVSENGKVIGMISMRDLLNQHTEYLEGVLDETISSLSLAISKKDPYTVNHQSRVASISEDIAKKMGFSPVQVKCISMAAKVHDIGKLYIPSEILSKPGDLSSIEFSLIKEHCRAGFEILQNVEFNFPLAQMVYQHHERIDGTGYPNGISGSEILIESRIISIADVFEAITSHRPYRPSLGMETAVRELTSKCGTHYDPEVVSALLEVYQLG